MDSDPQGFYKQGHGVWTDLKSSGEISKHFNRGGGCQIFIFPTNHSEKQKEMPLFTRICFSLSFILLIAIFYAF